MDACTVFSKSMLFFFNLACSLGALPMIAVSVICMINMSGVLNQIGITHVPLIPIWLIVLGISVFLMSFVGCCGILRRNICMLMYYTIILFIIIILQISFAIYAYMQIQESSGLEQELHSTMKDVFIYTQSKDVEVVNYVQRTLKCCGMYGPPGTNFPDSCCEKFEYGQCIPYKEGCWPILYGIVTNSLNILGTVAISLVVVEIAVAVMAIYVLRGFSKYRMAQ